MATTNTIAGTQIWVASYISQRLTAGVVSATEPALTAANKTMQFILSAPLIWEWNRASAVSAITTVAGTSDYAVSLANFGFLEKATLVNASPIGNTPPNFELDVYKSLSKDGKQNRPSKIATLLDNNAGSITFRLFPVPDAVYTVDLLYQNAPILATAGGSGLSSTWAPIPDKMAYLYEEGFRAEMQLMYNSQAGIAGMERFFRMVVGAAEGLSEMEKAIFLEESLRGLKTRTAELTNIQQGRQARQ